MQKYILTLALLPLGLAGEILPSKYFDNVKQLTSGGQNAEAYWSPDGTKLIFQSTRGSHQCDQIYIMNADGSDQRLVSTGKGVTTCGYFLPDGKHFVYASTHESGDACPPRPDRSKGYVWAVYPGFDIYQAQVADGKIVKKLTDTPGYDAEATVNFKSKRIVYTSMASGDLDLWSMKPDGSGKKQLTREVRYDGGAFYSRDGKKMVWRASALPDAAAVQRYKDLLQENLTAPMNMEIWIADANGRNAKQLTSNGCANFAPSFTPDGRKLVFASNMHKCGGRDFDLYMMNTDGTGLERITSYGVFTSFPEFSPDGKKLVFVSSLNAKDRYEFNIFVADWKN
jgi:Tol biopolymer transport system component